MRVLSIDIPCKSRSDKFILIPIGDIHKGVIQSNIPKLKELVSWIRKKKNCYVIIKGDAMDSIIQADIRFEMKNNDDDYNPDNTIEAQVNSLVKILMPIKDRILWVEEGNHEKKVRQRYATDATGMLAAKLGTKRLGTTNLVRILFKRKRTSPVFAVDTLKIFSSHGFGTSTSALGRLEGLSARIEADIYMAGHVHAKKLNIVPYLYLGRNGALKQKDRFYILTGSFYDTYKEGADSYGEDAGYKPEKTGVVRIDIEPFRHNGRGGDQDTHPIRIHASL
jgi:predicted phosphodiesterase